jgi:hypothetical protein
MDNISDCKDTTLFPNNQTFTIFFSNLFYRAFFYHIQNKKKQKYYLNPNIHKSIVVPHSKLQATYAEED